MLTLALIFMIGVLINAPTYFWVTYAVAASLWLVSSVLNLAKKFVEWSDKL